MKTMKEARELAQSLIDSYLAGEADEATFDLFHDVATAHALEFHEFDRLVGTRWFRDAVANEITSHEGVKGGVA